MYSRNRHKRYRKKRKEAIELYSEAIRLNPNDAFSYLNRGHLISGIDAWFSRNSYKKEAIKNYEKFVELCPDRPEGYRALGRAYEYLSDYKMSIKYFKKACHLGDKDCCIKVNQIKTRTRRFVREWVPGGDIFWNNSSKD